MIHKALGSILLCVIPGHRRWNCGWQEKGIHRGLGMVGIYLQSQHSRGRGRLDLCEFEASLVYRASSKIARAILKNPISGEKEKFDT